ncbi:LuxR C-terminal-related transcriptional regulator [Nonomuraea sp. NPDC005983]|uniref:LuxR C-terminal-related transcriptional regulator n=1 Tax=Nonomuraea sp. NPDC005983 TaxID=3155595 RepID=UPI0033AEB5B5
MSELSDEAVQIYLHVVRRGGATLAELREGLGLREPPAQATTWLTGMGLLREDSGGRLHAIGPALVAAETLEEEVRLRLEQLRLERTRSVLAELGPLYTRALDGWREGAVTAVPMTEADALLDSELSSCTEEVALVQPREESVARGLSRALERGIAVRLLCPHAHRRIARLRQEVLDLSGMGAQVRSVAEVPARVFILDARVALLPASGELAMMLVVREPTLVAFVHRVFESYWMSGEQFASEYSAPVLDDLRSTILAMLAEGAKDDFIARAIGLSVRSCRRHIAEIMKTLGAQSRFQAGYLAKELTLSAEE